MTSPPDRQTLLEDYFKDDLPASLVVFLVALPLCLGIAQASGVDPIAGVIAGIVGSIVVGLLSGSIVGVSGPAAGLAGIVISYMIQLQDYRIFLIVLVLSGVIQLLFGLLKIGVIAAYIPFNVVKGMLAAIGLLLFLKQIPHGLGFDRDAMGDMSFSQMDGQNTFSEIWIAIQHPHYGAIVVTTISIFVLITWEKPFIKKLPFISRVPSPLLVVLLGITLNAVFPHLSSDLILQDSHLVNIPSYKTVGKLIKHVPNPDFKYAYMLISEFRKDELIELLTMAFTIAVVSSLTCLLTVEATDRLDPLKRVTNPDRELRAQGIGNIIAGLIGGLPVAQVVIRSAANVNAGAKSKASAITHGVLLLIAVLTFPKALNLIPKASLAAILLVIGFKLTNFRLFINMYKLRKRQFIPFITTVLAILLTDILSGILIGLVVSIYFIIRTNRTQEPFDVKISRSDNPDREFTADYWLHQEVNYLSKRVISKSLKDIPENSEITIYGTESKYISGDVIDAIFEFEQHIAPRKNIKISFKRKPNLSVFELN
jgi:MFS superfamily sulfate permease-like transporter